MLGAIKRGEGALNLPPGRVGLFGARETFEYLADPNAFIRSRVAKYGPVFKTGFFFKPAIVFGSRAAVEEYKTFESTLPADAALPETFRELHTQYGALRQSGEEHKATRANFSAVLGRSALAHYAPILARQTRDFVQGDLASRGTLQPGYDLRQFCLRSLFELFIGAVPPESLMDRMYAYNEGLLALGKLSPEFEDGQKALDELTEFCLKHYRTVRAQGKLTDPEYFFLDHYSRATDENGDVFSDERIATTCVLMIWGAYIEAAASMGHTMWCLMRHPEAAEKVRAECRAAFTAEDLRDARLSLDDVYAKLKYTEAATKEALRVVPQTAGGLRVNPTLEDVGRVRRSRGVRAHRRPSRRVFGRGEFSGAGSVPARTVSRHERERSGRVLPGRDGAAQVSRDIALDAHDSDFSDVRDVDVRRMVARPRGRGVRRSRVHPGAHRHHRR